MGFGSLLARGISRELGYVRRENARIDYFNWRWDKLVHIQMLIAQDFIDPLAAVASQLKACEEEQLAEYIEDMMAWHSSIAQHINDARQNHLSRYATACKKTAMTAIRLCKKYGVYTDIESVEYDAERKMIILNGQDHYLLK